MLWFPSATYTAVPPFPSPPHPTGTERTSLAPSSSNTKSLVEIASSSTEKRVPAALTRGEEEEVSAGQAFPIHTKEHEKGDGILVERPRHGPAVRSTPEKKASHDEEVSPRFLSTTTAVQPRSTTSLSCQKISQMGWKYEREEWERVVEELLQEQVRCESTILAWMAKAEALERELHLLRGRATLRTECLLPSSDTPAVIPTSPPRTPIGCVQDEAPKEGRADCISSPSSLVKALEEAKWLQLRAELAAEQELAVMRREKRRAEQEREELYQRQAHMVEALRLFAQDWCEQAMGGTRASWRGRSRACLPPPPRLPPPPTLRRGPHPTRRSSPPRSSASTSFFSRAPPRYAAARLGNGYPSSLRSARHEEEAKRRRNKRKEDEEEEVELLAVQVVEEEEEEEEKQEWQRLRDPQWRPTREPPLRRPHGLSPTQSGGPYRGRGRAQDARCGTKPKNETKQEEEAWRLWQSLYCLLFSKEESTWWCSKRNSRNPSVSPVGNAALYAEQKRGVSPFSSSAALPSTTSRNEKDEKREEDAEIEEKERKRRETYEEQQQYYYHLLYLLRQTCNIGFDPS